MHQLLYVSRSRIHHAITGLIIPEMVFKARAQNKRLDVTGALIFTGTNFAQVLEGSKEAISDLMSSICIDPRHHSVSVIRELSIKERQFADWRMAYHGPPQFVSHYLSWFASSTIWPERSKRAEELVALAAISSSSQTPLAYIR